MKRKNHPHLVVLIFCLLFAHLNTSAQQSISWSQNGDSPKTFIENKGQFGAPSLPEAADKDILFAIDDNGTFVGFSKSGIQYSFLERTSGKKEKKPEHFRNAKQWKEEESKEQEAVCKKDRVTSIWEGANKNVQVIAEEETDHYYSYSIKEKNKDNNINHIRGYKKLIYKNIYPNIDVEYAFHPQSGIKYALILHPGADVSKVKMKYSGKVSLDKDGNVLAPTVFGNIVDHAPLSFYTDDHSSLISSAFKRDGKTISFELKNYDPKRSVTIDPWTNMPALANAKRIWETETDGTGNVYIYGGDSPLKLIKYNSAGALQWTYTSSWDTANFWIGGFITDPTGNSYITSGSNGEISKITAAGGLAWTNNPNSVTAYEYWSLAFNCDLTHLVVGGSRSTFGIPSPTIVGTVMEINLASGALSSTTVVGYGGMGSGFPPAPNMQEVSSICMGPTGGYYFLTLDTVGSINTALSAIKFKTGTGYNFNYYIPGYTLKNKQPISAIRANGTAFYTLNGATIHKRSLTTGAVLATAAIPGGISTVAPVIGGNLNGNGGLDLDNCGNVYVGSGNQVVKYDANLNVLSSTAVSFAVYDVDVNSNGEVIACGYGGGNGYVQSLSMSACAQLPYTCVASPLSVASTATTLNCNGQCTATATANPSGGTGAYTYSWNTTPAQTTQTATALCAGTYTASVKDGAGTTTLSTVIIVAPAALSAAATSTAAGCGTATGSATVTASGGTGTLTYSWAPTGGTAAGASNLTSGNYTCTVTDANGCSQTAATTVAGATGPTVSSTQTNLLCNGVSTGSITVTPSGGTLPYTYSWSPSGGTGATASNLAAGTYTSTVTDATGCIKTQTILITQPGPITASASATNATCGSNNGTASVTASGGTGALVYSWLPSGGTASTANSLSSGTYTCTVTDTKGCTNKVTVAVNSAGGPAVTLSAQTNEKCNGGSIGSASCTATGGTGTYTYSWSPSGGTGATANNLPAGTYTLSVKDAAGCLQTQTVIITQPSALVASATSTNTSCGASSGSASVTASGGTGTLSYSWSPSGGSAANASALAAGNYTCTVTDANGCSKVVSASVNSTGGPLVTLSTQTNETCNGAKTGAATFSASGGTLPYTYSWSPAGGTAASASNLAAGTYTLTILDAGGCSQTKTVVITEPPVIGATLTATQTACGSSTGSATVTATGGTGTLSYSWSPSGGTAATASSLAAGTYTCTVTDGNACTKSFPVTVSSAGGPTVTLSAQNNVSCNGGSNGSAATSISGGTAPYTYSWNTVPPQTTSGATALGAGTYTVSVHDASGCLQFVTVTITQPAALNINTLSLPACGLLNGSATANVSGGNGPYTYSWTPSGGTAQNAGGLVAGNYTCTVTDANGCVKTNAVSVVADSVPVAKAGSTVVIAYGSTTLLNASGGATYKWIPATGLNCSTCQSPIAGPLSTTTYCVAVTNSHACSDTACVTVQVDLICGEVFVPNFFSPNEDGENDQLCLYGKCIQKLYFAIYDRWGEKVFETTDPNHCWDGFYKGQKMNAAVFVYYLHADLISGQTITKKGNISLVR
jgi:gliding motility-associated-like protein